MRIWDHLINTNPKPYPLNEGLGGDFWWTWGGLGGDWGGPGGGVGGTGGGGGVIGNMLGDYECGGGAEKHRERAGDRRGKTVEKETKGWTGRKGNCGKKITCG